MDERHGDGHARPWMFSGAACSLVWPTSCSPSACRVLSIARCLGTLRLCNRARRKTSWDRKHPWQVAY